MRSEESKDDKTFDFITKDLDSVKLSHSLVGSCKLPKHIHQEITAMSFGQGSENDTKKDQ